MRCRAFIAYVSMLIPTASRAVESKQLEVQALSDQEIAKQVKAQNISHIAASLGVPFENIQPYGHDKAKLPLSLIDLKKARKSRLVLVSAISPTPAGEGKTTTTIGLLDGLRSFGYKAIAALREPSLGPVFGMKGGATGGGYAQVIPMEDINLHFTGDFSAVEKAHNLLSAVIDNTLHHHNMDFDLDPESVVWKRVMDLNDRSLRHVQIGREGSAHGVERETGFDITAASEVMAILCLATDIADLKKRLGNIYIGLTTEGADVYARDLKVHGAMAALLKDAIKPNLVQTLEGNPVVIHGGPFANIAHGCNSVLATQMAMTLGDYVVTEAGFGCDLGAEKFFHIKCRSADLQPSAIVLVATLKALKYHGGLALESVKTPNLQALELGFQNLEKHLENTKALGVPVVVSLNKFSHDTDEELAWLRAACESLGVQVAVCEAWEKGGVGAQELSTKLLHVMGEHAPVWKPVYQLEQTIKQKIENLVVNYYGGAGVQYSAQAEKQVQKANELGLSSLPICMAKTEKSFSDQPKNRGRPKDFILHIRDLEIAAGAGYLIPIAGRIMRMPGLPSRPAVEAIDVHDEGLITGLF